VLTTLAEDHDFGRFFPDGMLLTNVEADLSCQPDGIFVLTSEIDSIGHPKYQLHVK
jgi:hypothetical protein